MEERVTVLIPYFNESATIGKVLAEIPPEYHVIVVDDGSDGDFPRIRRRNFRIITNPRNMGKGYSIRHGLLFVRGIVVLTDADGELSVKDIPKLVAPILEGKADVVFGSRFLNTESRRVLGTTHYLATKALTFIGNLVSGRYITDMNCGAKAFRREDFVKLKMRENRFGFEPEFTMKSLKSGLRAWEVAVEYTHRRTKEQGKKVRIWDVFNHLWCIARYGW
jgi:glycosyltransferase involved in cell wall biosynthesis